MYVYSDTFIAVIIVNLLFVKTLLNTDSVYFELSLHLSLLTWFIRKAHLRTKLESLSPYQNTLFSSSGSWSSRV